MNAAMAKGQATLPDFDAALGRHIERALLNVRVPYGTSGKEYLWLTDVRRNPDGSYDGIVTGEVLHISDLHEGSSYHAARSVAVD